VSGRKKGGERVAHHHIPSEKKRQDSQTKKKEGTRSASSKEKKKTKKKNRQKGERRKRARFGLQDCREVGEEGSRCILSYRGKRSGRKKNLCLLVESTGQKGAVLLGAWTEKTKREEGGPAIPKTVNLRRPVQNIPPSRKTWKTYVEKRVPAFSAEGGEKGGE